MINSRCAALLIIIIISKAGGNEPVVYKPIRLQYVSEVYRKKFYVKIPPARIKVKLRNEILSTIQKTISFHFQARLISSKGKWLDQKWIQRLKCHPAANIKIYKKSAPKKFTILLLYPQSYCELIEDPLIDDDLPITYIGSVKRVAFYCYPAHAHNNSTILRIINKLQLVNPRRIVPRTR